MTRLELRRTAISIGEMAYAEEGHGPAVVLLHGFPTSAHLWRDLLPLLAPRCRAIAPDLIGYGSSSKPSGASLGVEAQAGYVRELLRSLGVDRFAAVGHGAGGAVAQLLAFDGVVDVLVLVNSFALGEWGAGALETARGAGDGGAHARVVEDAVRGVLRGGMGHPERLADEDLEVYAEPWREDPDALVRAAGALDGGALEGSEARLGALEMPAFLVWGEDDPWLPASLAEGLQDAMPGAAAALLPGCSHFVTEDASETVVPMLVEFLRLRYLGERHAHGGPAGGGEEPTFDRPPGWPTVLGPGEPDAREGSWP